ncbi:hypothetical protein [Raoultella ornithinolytica]|uniref:hypothetical protein n=1 Tax=Raoultella ornithinolytica TaxID=54291 RepID=UPI00292A82ED|nr:hypothetical protein [Raoultella ornithinolytica]MDV1100441.1 hypothetical protein [Raoultella ornithinolytica]
MPFRTAIRWLHRLVTLALLALIVGFVWLNHHPDPRKSDELQRVYKLSDGVWLYMTVNNRGGATVPTIYRYEIAGDNTEIIQQLTQKSPVIEGTGSLTSAGIDKNGEVNLSYSGKVISLQDNISDLRFSVKP